MRILFVGGTRFIGAHAARRLAEEGHDVTVFHRGATESELTERVRHVHDGSASTPVTAFPPELLRVPYDAVVHMTLMGEADACASVAAFAGRAGRLVAISSGDVTLAYGRLTRLEPGPPVPVPLTEEAELRSVLYPYRKSAPDPSHLHHAYEKILVERVVRQAKGLPSVVLRLPKVYGPGAPDSFMGLASIPAAWRWTHGYVEDVAAAIALAALHPAAPGRLYNVGEEQTRTTAERLGDLGGATPPAPPGAFDAFDFAQHLVFDTSRIRKELGYAEPVAYEEGVRRTRHAAVEASA